MVRRPPLPVAMAMLLAWTAPFVVWWLLGVGRPGALTRTAVPAPAAAGRDRPRRSPADGAG
ncbi:hypothetical protein G7Z12_02605 [Streptomyces sp. ID38640]|uniref:hypothetical protein n=1 Tax=Streptomyces sp. ID38640 TaxID=1265399 RepID=UPI00140EE934|nr:hypothetical protein [Streptomyces sp. ID38640]QIK05094.1 hypothetical protein G7Z12_02605 [Streptomyces sp. ID38640]